MRKKGHCSKKTREESAEEDNRERRQPPGKDGKQKRKEGSTGKRGEGMDPEE